jgi:hypothetical protein
MKLYNVGSNQTLLVLNDGTEVFFSYNTPVAASTNDLGLVRTSKKHSVTTSKHINQWLNGRYSSLVSQEFLDNLVQ